MKLTRVSINGFARIADRELTLGHAAERGSFALVSGAAGSGKTALLELLIAGKEGWAPAGVRLPWQPQSRDGNGAKLTADWLLAERTVNAELIFDSALGFHEPPDETLRECLTGYSLSPSLWKMEYFHEGRALGRHVGLQNGRGARRLELDGEKYGALPGLLDRMLAEDIGDARRSRLNGALSAFGLELRAASRGGFLIRTPRGEQEVRALPSSEQQLFLLLAGSLALGLDRALVLIDTLEQGLPLAWAAKLADVLPALLPDAQIIATTRSPELFPNAALHIQLR